jgi:Flp pilus assembly protein TadG
MKDIRLKNIFSSRIKEQRGAVIVLVAVLMVVFIGLAALAIDVSHLVVVRNELQNAADAGALAGARVLINPDGTVNSGANQEAYEAATENRALTADGALPVDILDWSSNNGDVQRGNWNLATKTFTSSTSMDPNYINAVRVEARREDTPAASFFARIFGYEEFFLARPAVAYVGYPGTFTPQQPVAVCKQSILDSDGDLTCTTGRMLDSSGSATSNTAAWTNFSQPCATATPPSVRPLICAPAENIPSVSYGIGMGTINGMVDNVYRDLRDCWLDNTDLEKDWRGYPKEAWRLTLPVIDCPSSVISTCSTILGAVSVDLLWIKESNADPQWLDVPVQMEEWECAGWVAAGRPTNLNSGMSSAQRQQCWRDFATEFQLQRADGTSVGNLSASELLKTMFFRPNCEFRLPTGTPGGENFGVRANPVLVQ